MGDEKWVQLADTPKVDGLTFRHFRDERDFPALVGVIEACQDHDKVDPLSSEAGLPTVAELAKSFSCIDIFSDEAMEKIGQIITTCEKPLAIFFDNGNKPREWRIYAPLTQPGDYCVVHDWDTEFTEADINGPHWGPNSRTR